MIIHTPWVQHVFLPDVPEHYNRNRDWWTTVFKLQLHIDSALFNQPPTLAIPYWPISQYDPKYPNVKQSVTVFNWSAFHYRRDRDWLILTCIYRSFCRDLFPSFPCIDFACRSNSHCCRSLVRQRVPSAGSPSCILMKTLSFYLNYLSWFWIHSVRK